MSISVEGGKGRGKAMGVELNLVPFIDFLSCLIAFLMMTAVMTEIHAVDVEQSISPPDPNQIPPDPPPPPPLTVAVNLDSLWIARKVEEGQKLPKDGEEMDWAKLEEIMVKDRETFPTEDMIVINTSDGVPFESMMGVLDMSRRLGYAKTALAGGPAAASPANAPIPVAPAGVP